MLAAIVAAVILLGVFVGVLWSAITPTVGGRVIEVGVGQLDDAEAGAEFGGVATMTLLLFGYGLVVAVLAWFVGRCWRGPEAFLAVAGGSILGSVVAVIVGDRTALWRFGDPTTMPVGSGFQYTVHFFDDDRWWSLIPTPWVLLISAPLGVALAYGAFALMSDGDLGLGDADDALTDFREHPQPTPTALGS